MSTESVASKPKAVVDEAVNQGELAFAVAAIGNSEGQLWAHAAGHRDCLLYTSPSPRDLSTSRMPSSA